MSSDSIVEIVTSRLTEMLTHPESSSINGIDRNQFTQLLDSDTSSDDQNMAEHSPFNDTEISTLSDALSLSEEQMRQLLMVANKHRNGNDAFSSDEIFSTLDTNSDGWLNTDNSIID